MLIKAQLGMVIPCTQFSWDMKSHQVSKNHLWRVRVKGGRGENVFLLRLFYFFGGKTPRNKWPKTLHILAVLPRQPRNQYRERILYKWERMPLTMLANVVNQDKHWKNNSLYKNKKKNYKQNLASRISGNTGGRVGIGEGNGTPLQYSCLENPMDRGAW